jgi:hypothetical protein
MFVASFGTRYGPFVNASYSSRASLPADNMRSLISIGLVLPPGSSPPDAVAGLRESP